MLGENDPGSAQNWRKSNDFCSPVIHEISEKFKMEEVVLINPAAVWGNV